MNTLLKFPRTELALFVVSLVITLVAPDPLDTTVIRVEILRDSSLFAIPIGWLLKQSELRSRGWELALLIASGAVIVYSKVPGVVSDNGFTWGIAALISIPFFLAALLSLIRKTVNKPTVTT